MHWIFIITLIAASGGECFILITLAGGENAFIFVFLRHSKGLNVECRKAFGSLKRFFFGAAYLQEIRKQIS